MRKTILYDKHLEHGAKMVEFAGYLMPIEYTGLSEEHLAVRKSWGMFDCSHMGEVLISGPDSTAFVNYLMTSSVKDQEYRMTYGMLLDESGCVIDDLMCYHYNDQKNLLVVNASNREKDVAWIESQKGDFDVVIQDLSDSISLLAVQGKVAVDHLQKLTEDDITSMKMYDFKEVKLSGLSFMISRSGYTGEDGFEIYGSNAHILEIFDVLVKSGATLCGLGCRDTLRFEAAMPLYGHEIDADINPLEAGLSFAVDLTKNFIGRDALLQVKEKGLTRKIVGLKLLEKGIARGGYKVFSGETEIGVITTGYLIPGTEKAVAMAMIDKDHWDLGNEVLVQIRKNMVRAVIRNKKFLEKKYKK